MRLLPSASKSAAAATVVFLAVGFGTARQASAMSTSAPYKVFQTLPRLIVFDLDMCLWSPEMYELDEIPTSREKSAVLGPLTPDGTEQGVIGVRSGHETIRLFPDARAILRDYYLGTAFPPTVRLAAASSADTPRAVSIGRAAMSILEVLPGVTMKQVLSKGWPDGYEGHLQIGRTPPLSSDKAATHFPILHAETKIPYNEMIFFDDCNWGDHVGSVYSRHGVIGQRTPKGLTMREFLMCLDAFDKAAVARGAGSSSGDL